VEQQHEHREVAASRILEEAGIVTHPDGSEREPTPEPHPFDTGTGDAQGGGDEAADGSQPGTESGAESHDDAAATAPEHGGDKQVEAPAGTSEEPGPGSADDAEPPGEPGEGEGEQQAELDLTALAESLEISVEELYQVEIPLGGEDGNFTLGEVKDQVRELRSITSQREILSQDQTSNENAKLVARQELQTVVAMLGDSISPELLEHARAQLRSEIQRERGLIFEAIPEWQDQETAERDRTAINEFLRGYGFSDAELAQVYDHRLLKLARDSQRNQNKLRTAAEQASPQRSLPGKPGRKQNSQALKRRRRQQKQESARTGGPDEKLAAVAALISGD